MAAPLLRKIRVLAAKLEGTPGTAETLAAADAVFNAFNVEAQMGIEFIGREGQGVFSPLTGAFGGYMGTLSFEVEMVGGATAPDWMATLLPACGWKNTSGTFTPLSAAPEAGTGTKTVTIAVYENGRVKKLHGAMGTFVMTFPAGKPCRCAFTFTGIWNTVADATILAPTYPTTAPLRFASATCSIAAVVQRVSQFQIDAGNQVTMRETPQTTSGFHSANITGRNITCSLDPEGALVATYDPYGDMLARTERALSVIVGSSGNRLTIAAPKLQITNVQGGERNGLQIDTISGQLNRSAAGGDDEISIVSD